MGVVADTSVLVATVRYRETDSSGNQMTWNRLLGRLEDGSEVLPIAVYAELLVGVHLAKSVAQVASRHARIDALTARVPSIDCNAAIARQ